ncbi:TPA: hypothetical protein DIV55_06855 [Patescibacteria group bacterium]|uniref:Uncharacterized protein n=1 Tax=Candidatus Gottesmanbacteria bacterium GW2011_GWA1_43_11 TaxID=1618436 RepID=A0A0G1CHE9_9BACT|nr:MAG: hypothetical protein UV59_C0009G0012 [Candidatus Gottesmanbacteria bacterium GW2011_GWA1_43_11]HCS79424.1 hypothetical protein [Patescibacteria group bacterium]
MTDIPLNIENPHSQKGLLSLIRPGVERERVLYLKRIRDTLTAKIPQAADLPLTYLGSGGDLRSALIVSDRPADTYLILINDTHFLNHADQPPYTLKEIEEVWRHEINSGHFTPQHNIEPGKQMLFQLYQLGIEPMMVRKKVHADGSAALEFSVPELTNDQERNVRIDYLNQRIASTTDFANALAQLNVSETGLLCKAQTGGIILKLLQEWSRQKADSLILPPSYLVIDDLQMYAGHDLTQREEQELFPGFTIVADIRDQKVELGYSWRESGEETYKSRFVIYQRRREFGGHTVK